MPKTNLLLATDNDADELVPERAFCEECGITDHTAREWRRRGTGPEYLRLGKAVFYRRSRIKRWHDSRSFRRRIDETAA
jgi:hypothetical protein